MRIQNAILAGIFVASGLIGCTSEKSGSSETSSEEVKTKQAVSSTDSDVKEEKVVEVASIKWDELVYDFGEVNEGDEVKHVYTFKNNGEVPLIISRVKASCGCTTPTYTKAPVAPGESGEINVKFNSKNRAGKQVKTITVYANVENGKSEVRLQGIVKKEKELEGPFKNQ
ncbi:DUF1573 domain-containing protein [Sediminitomix flava]|uniref:Uncharacterized protein DUF1573 n=1 Tax=Sediminitomix flava TaxID=379075 RepID=A0A315Z0M0_SEDFL|nr:DUF1573 domain-containing protein [Sediminitomix flava]PWJ36102.1 uncharacterized protein DUF1573 [Sediminitomix flava]